MKIGIMGGTFNPIHTGHLVLAEEVREKCRLDKVLFVVGGNPPHKVGSVSGLDRLHMVEHAVEGNPFFESCDVEVSREGYSYTSDTIAFLKSKYPDDELYFIAGADAIYGLDTWHDVSYLAKNMTFLGATRPGVDKSSLRKKVDELKQDYDFDIRLYEVTELDISSSDIRDRVNEGRTIRYLLPETVSQYIVDKELYIDRHPLYKEMYRLAKERLSEKRFAHSVRVGSMARRLAIQYGEDYKKAELAGLLHDFSKEDSVEETLDVIRRHGIETPSCIVNHPTLAHGEVAAAILKEQGYIEDEDILNAMRWHTYGCENMSMLSKIVYIADVVEPGRPLYNGMAETRKEVEKSIDKAILTWQNYSIVEDVHPNTRLMCDKIKETMEEKYD